VFLHGVAQTTSSLRAPIRKRAQPWRALRPKHRGTINRSAHPHLAELAANDGDGFGKIALDECHRNAHDAIANAPESGVPPRITLPMKKMRSIVDLNDELATGSAEVDDVELLSGAAEHDLPTKPDAQLRPLESVPHERFVVRRVKAHKYREALRASAVFFSATTRIGRKQSETRSARQSGPFRPAEEPGSARPWRRSRDSGAGRMLTNTLAPLARGVRLPRRARLEGGAESVALAERYCREQPG
jgi:hypothetical protein